MSEATAAAPEKNSYQEAVALMKKMGSKRGFNPIPPSQHERMMGKDQPLFTRVWGAMLHFTIGWGHRSPYAVDKDGKEMHVEHFAHMLQVDTENTRKCLDDGADMGYWRKGTKPEGKRRWYLCGEVPQFEGELKDLSEKGMRRLFPAYILNPLNKLSPEMQRQFWAEDEADAKAEKRLRADLDETRRTLITLRQNTRLERFGLPQIREQEHKPKDAKVAASRVELRQRVQGLLPLLEPLVERYAHTFSESAQPSENGSRKVEKSESAHAATLLPVKSPVEKAVRESPADVPRSDATHSSSGPVPKDGKKPIKQLPVPPTPEPAPKLTEHEAQAFATLRSWQKDYKQCDFGEDVSIHNKGQLTTVRRILATVKQDLEFFTWAETEKIPRVRSPLGKQPGKGTGGRFLGLVCDWADEFMRAGPELKRREQEKREVFAKAAKRQEEAEERRKQQAIADMRRAIADPTTPPADRQMAREVLEAYGVSEEEGATHG